MKGHDLDFRPLVEDQFEFDGKKFKELPLIVIEDRNNVWLTGMKKCVEDVSKDFHEFCKIHCT